MSKLVNRLGNKEKIAHEIYKYFPAHEIYIEPFFGAGGMLLNKPQAKFNFVNDLDDNITNLYWVLTRQKKELVDYLEYVPYSVKFFKDIETVQPLNDLERAVWFVVKSNWGFLGKPDTLDFGIDSKRKFTIKNLIDCYSKFQKFEVLEVSNKNFEKFLCSIKRLEKNTDRAFIYADKPYSATTDNYSNTWQKSDDEQLLNALLKTNCKFAISEYDNGRFEQIAHGLHKTIIHVNQGGLGSKSQECIFTNYKIHQTLF